MDVAGVLAACQQPRRSARRSRAGSRFAEQASWLRTSTSGSIAARWASFGGHGGEAWPASPSSRTVQSRTYGSAWSSVFERRRLVQAADQVQGPERLEGGLARLGRDQALQLRSDRRILAIADQAQGRLADPAVGVGRGA